MNRLELDDTDSRIGYSGAWTPLKGSSRQWQSTTHSTTQTGASASVNFQGTRVVIYTTVPTGSGTNIHTTVILDGKKTPLTHSTNATTIYNFVLFDSGSISDTPHTISLLNTGSGPDSPLQLDRFHLEGDNFSNVGPGVISTTKPISTPVGTSSVIKSTISTVLSKSSTAGMSGSSPGPSVPSISLSSSTSISLKSSSSAPGSPGVFGDESEIPQNLAVPQTLKDTAVALPLQTSHGRDPTSVSVRLVTSTEADGTVVTKVIVPPNSTPSATSSRFPTAAIAGGVFGAVAFVTLLIFLLLRFIRRNRGDGHVQLHDGDESVRSPSDLTTAIPFHHERDHQQLNGKGRDSTSSHQPSRLRTKFSSGGDISVATATVTPSRSRQNTLDEIHPDIDSSEPATYVYNPRLDQLTDAGPVPIGSSVMLLMIDSYDLPPSYQATV